MAGVEEELDHASNKEEMQDLWVGSDKNEDEVWLNSVANAECPPSSVARIHRVPTMLRDTKDYDKYYVPKVVSLGPYHCCNSKLEFVQNLKPVFANRLLVEEDKLRSLYNELGNAEIVRELRGFYEERSTNHLSDKEFTRMMLLDGCFILYYIRFIYLGKEEDYLGLKSHQIVFVQQDLFLLENQIPFRVLNEVIKLVTDEHWSFKIERFIKDNILARERRKSRWCRIKSIWPPFSSTDQSAQGSSTEKEVTGGHYKEDHLLQLLQIRLTKQKDPIDAEHNGDNRYTYRNANELLDVGIHFKPSKTMSLAQIEFSGHGLFANLHLPPITVDDSTKPMFLNLVAYEMCSDLPNSSWVTSYICLLDSLIDHAQDVKVLRKAGVLDNCLGSDKEVALLFNEIGTDLVPNSFAYSEAKKALQKHYESQRNTLISQLKHEYIKSPWSFIAFVGGVLVLFLSGVQAYFSVWSLPGECDSLCVALKNNHHL